MLSRTMQKRKEIPGRSLNNSVEMEKMMQRRLKKKLMTPFYRFFAVVSALALLTGCGKKEAEPAASVAEQPPAENVAEDNAAGEAVSFSESGIMMDVLYAPSGITVMADGTILMTDVYNKRIWKVRKDGSEIYAGGETTIGLYGEPMGGYNDAESLASTFRYPWAVTKFLDGWAVSDTDNKVVRLVLDQKVQTVNPKEAGSGEEVSFKRPTGLASDADGNLYIADTGNGTVHKINPKGEIETVADGLNEPMGLFWKDDVLYIAETGANRIVKLENGNIVPVAGSGEEGLEDGSAEKALFAAPQGVAVGDDGSIYVADTLNSAVRRIKDGQVDTLAARDTTDAGFGLVSPTGLLAQGKQLYVCDVFSKKLFVLEMG